MSATSKTVSEIQSQLHPPELRSEEDRRYRELYSAFGERTLGEEQAWAVIERVEDREGDGAWASGRLLVLELAGVVDKHDGGYRRAETFPDLGDDDEMRSGTEAYRREEEKERREERERLASIRQ